MKKFLSLTILISFFVLKSFSQYFQETRTLFSTPSCCASYMSAGANYFCFDEFGRSYYHAYAQTCLACYQDSYHSRYDFNNSSVSSYHSFFGYTLKVFPGHSGNFYGFTGNNNYLIKIKNNGSSAWSIPLSASNAAYNYINEDYFGNVYALAGDSLKKYDSTGVYKWAKSGGGTIIKADLSGNYYIVNGSVSKYDSSGNLIRNMAYNNINDLLIDPACHIYFSGSAGITKLDSAGNLIFQYPLGGGKIAIDKNENVYFLSTQAVKKLDSTGTVIKWTANFPAGALRGVGVDSLFNCYVMGDFSTGFVPPGSFYSYNTIAANSYYLFITKLSSQLYSDTVKVQSISPVKHSVCLGDSISINIKCFLQQSMPPFKVELSDSTGSFANPLLLGTSSSTYFKVLIPASIPSAFGYRIRAITTTGSPIIIPNTDGPFKINIPPPALITVTNYTSFINNVYYGCSGNPMNLNSNTDPNFIYQWYKAEWIGGPGGYYSYTAISGQTNSTYSPLQGYGYSVRNTDTVTGCGRIAPVINAIYSNSAPATITNLPGAVCINQSPITLIGSPFGGTFSGAGIYYNKFYPDSAGTGTHTIVYTINTPGCGISDTTATITVNHLPSAVISTNGSATFCSGASVVLNAPANANCTYQWKKGGNDIAGATASNYTASVGGVYKVTVTNSITGCSKTSVTGVLVTVNPQPNSIITPQGPTTFCAGGSVLLSANTGTGLTYQWKKGGTNIPAATSDNYTATIGGVYKVREVNTYGCVKLSSGIVVSVPCREEAELNEITGGISIFPNPASGKFTIQSVTEKISHITLTNLSAQTIYKKEFLSSPLGARGFEIDLGNHSKGVYLIHLVTDKKVYNQKIILN